MGTAVTTVQRPPEKPVQRSAHSSAVGHGLGLGGNGALWAFGTYGWGWAAAIGGLTAAGMGIKHLRNKRRGSRGGGLFGARSGGSRGGLLGGLGRKRSGGGLGLGGGRGKGGRSGGLGTRSGRAGGSGKGAGGFLSKLAGKRSSTPKGGGGVPGRGSKKGGLLGRKGGGLLGGKGAGTKAGGSRRGGGLLSGGKGGGRKGGGSGGSGGGGKGKRGLLSQLNPFRNRGGGSGGGKGKGGGKDKGKGKGKNKGKNKDRNPDNASPPSGWEEAPLNPNHIKWEDITMADPTATPRRRVAAPGGGGGRAGGRGLTAAAEQFAGTLAKPPTPVNTLKTFDADLGDLANAVEVLQSGVKNHTAVVQAGMPAETYAHEELARYAQQFGQIAAGLKVLQADARRRLALDHERVDNGRPNEKGYDWNTNQQ